MSRELRQAAIDAAIECVAAIDGDASRAKFALEAIERMRDAIALDAEIDGETQSIRGEISLLRRHLSECDAQMTELLQAWQSLAKTIRKRVPVPE